MIIELYLGTVAVSTGMLACSGAVRGYRLKKDGYKFKKDYTSNMIPAFVSLIVVPGMNVFFSSCYVIGSLKNNYDYLLKTYLEHDKIEPIKKQLKKSE